jgi:hypothetical protein
MPALLSRERFEYTILPPKKQRIFLPKWGLTAMCWYVTFLVS